MYKRIAAIFLSFCMIIGLIPALSACSPSKYDSLPDSYNAETDYPHTFSAYDFGWSTAPNEDGYYFKEGNFLFYMDAESKEVVPFCNRPDCLHIKEKDPSKVWKCNAYIGSPHNEQIQFYNNKLYYITNFSKEDAALNLTIPTLLSSSSADSSNRETISEIDPDTGGVSFYIHRGYFYIATNGTDLKSGDAHFTLKRVRFERVKQDEPEILFESTLFNPSITLYGNHIYMSGGLVEDLNYTGEIRTYDFNIKTKEVSTVSKSKYLAGILNEKLLLREPINVENSKTAQLFLYDSDTQQEIKYFSVPKVEKRLVNIYTDGYYFYILDGAQEVVSEDKGEWYLQVYDLRGNLVNEQDLNFLPELICFVPGDERYAFIMFELHSEKEKYSAVTVLDKQNNFMCETICQYSTDLLYPNASIDVDSN